MTGEAKALAQRIVKTMFRFNDFMIETLDEIEGLAPQSDVVKEVAEELGSQLGSELRDLQINLSNVTESVENGLGLVFDNPSAIEPDPIPMHLWCPKCHEQHFDVGEFAVRPHKTHTCQSCGLHWQPALVPTVGVKFLPGCENRHEAAS